MKWFSEISPKHVQTWSRLLRYQYEMCLRTWCSVRGRRFNRASQVATFDCTLVKGKRVCYWYELTTQLHADGYNPLQVVRYKFDQSLLHSHSEYPRPSQLRYPKIAAAELKEHFARFAKVGIDSGLAILSRVRDLVSVTYGNALTADQLTEVIADLIGPKLHNSVVRAAVLGPADTTAKALVHCEFLTSPETYLSLAPQLVPQSLRALVSLDGGAIG